MNHSEKELKILEKIHNNEDSIRQRDLAKIAGLSLGMTNSILKRLIDKGFLTVKKVNNRNIKYVVSPLGIEEISKRSLKYFKRTIKNVVVYKEALEDVVSILKEDGYNTVVLIGQSDIDFILEHACIKENISFFISDDAIPEKKNKRFYIFSESYDTPLEEEENIKYLKKILLEG